jgi:hypothetical protein
MGYSQSQLRGNLLDGGCGSQEKTAEKRGILPVKSEQTGENQEKTGKKP